MPRRGQFSRAVDNNPNAMRITYGWCYGTGVRRGSCCPDSALGSRKSWVSLPRPDRLVVARA